MDYKNKTSLSYRISETLYKRGKMTMDELSGVFPECRAIVLGPKVGALCAAGDLEKIGDKFDIQPHVRRYFAKANGDVCDVAGSRAAIEFKPLQQKNMFWLAPRREPIRDDVSFKTGSVGFPTGHYA